MNEKISNIKGFFIVCMIIYGIIAAFNFLIASIIYNIILIFIMYWLLIKKRIILQMYIKFLGISMLIIAVATYLNFVVTSAHVSYIWLLCDSIQYIIWQGIFTLSSYWYTRRNAQ